MHHHQFGDERDGERDGGEVDREGEPREESKAQVVETQMIQVETNKAD